MENVTMGMKYDFNFLYDKLGDYEQIPLTRGNPNILKAFYYPKADMTIIVNTYYMQIDVWRKGRQGS